jgi:hypothetical protein
VFAMIHHPITSISRREPGSARPRWCRVAPMRSFSLLFGISIFGIGVARVRVMPRLLSTPNDWVFRESIDLSVTIY